MVEDSAVVGNSAAHNTVENSVADNSVADNSVVGNSPSVPAASAVGTDDQPDDPANVEMLTR